MIISKILTRPDAPQPAGKVEPISYGGRHYPRKTRAGRVVSAESSKSVATAYRAKNILGDAFAITPLHLFQIQGDRKIRVAPDARARNNPYLLEISPNLWGWTPFLFKKNLIEWVIFYGNSFAWSPPVWPFQKYILPGDSTYPVFDEEGDLWYATTLADGTRSYIPGAEVLHWLINPDETGHMGRGVIEYARETIGRQMGAYDAESQIFADGLTPAAYMQVAATLDAKGRAAYRDSYGEIMSADGPRLAVFDNRITKFEPVTMNPVDAQFLELIGATDRDIANFFGMPLHMLNMGKESFNSNEQKYLEYRSETLDPYFVQFEQGARLKWLAEDQIVDHFWKFNRDAIMRMDGMSRAQMNEVLIRSGQRNLDEVRDKDDMSALPDGLGQKFYMTKNYTDIQEQDPGPASDSRSQT